MAKMKVHELAKELEIQSKDVISFLQGKGYDVKVAQSSIDEEEIGLVRKQFGAGNSEAAKSIPEKGECSFKGRVCERERGRRDAKEEKEHHYCQQFS